MSAFAGDRSQREEDLMRRQLADALGTEQTGGKSKGSAALRDQDRVQVYKKSALMCSSCSRSVVASPELLITFGECPEVQSVDARGARVGSVDVR